MQIIAAIADWTGVGGHFDKPMNGVKFEQFCIGAKGDFHLLHLPKSSSAMAISFRNFMMYIIC